MLKIKTVNPLNKRYDRINFDMNTHINKHCFLGHFDILVCPNLRGYFRMRGQPLNSQSQELVWSLINYFQKEKENNGPLIPLDAVLEVKFRTADETPLI